MTALQNLKIWFIQIFTVLIFSNAVAQVNQVNQYISKVNDKVNQVNQMANNKQVIEAMELLNETRRDFDSYLTYYFEDEMRAAKLEDDSFRPTFNVRFSQVLTASYWENRVEQAQRSINLAEEAFAERNHQRTLDSQDEVWSYLKTVYGVGKTIKDVYENVQTMELYDAVKSAKEGVDNFIDNYKEIENARLQIINTQLYETQIQGLIRRGKIMEERCWQFASFMRAYEQDVNDFYSLSDRFNQMVDQVKNEAAVDWSDSKYNWNKQSWLNQARAAANRFKQGGVDYYDLKVEIEKINEAAEVQKDNIYQNIINSGANDAFERGNKLENEFNDFYDLSIDVLDECYAFSQSTKEGQNLNTSQVSTGNSINNSTDDVYGIDKNKYLKRVHEIGGQYQNGELSQTDFIKVKWRQILNDYSYECSLFAGAFKSKEKANEAQAAWQSFSDEMVKVVNAYISGESVQNDGDIGTVKNSGEVSNSEQTQSADLFAGASGTSNSEKTNNSTLNTSSSQATNTSPSKTAAQKTTTTKQTTQNKELQKVSSAVNKMPKTGASNMARIPVYQLKENDKLVFKQTGGSFLKFYVRWVGKNFSEVLYKETKQIVYSTAELMAKRPEQAMYIDFQVNQYSDVYCYMEGWVIPPGVSIPSEWNIAENNGGSSGNNASANFYELIKKADEAFNRKYWNESGGVSASSNPKQESLDLLRRCEPLIARENDMPTKYQMIKILSGKYSEYAKRVFVYSAKSDFVQLAGALLGKYGGQANSLDNSSTKSSAYTSIAESWRELTKAATWGDHQYNKMYCDKESKKYYDMALSEDQNNSQLQKTVEKINAPKKPIPPKVAATPSIPEEKWSTAENLRNVVFEDDFTKKILEEEQPNYLEVGVLSLNVGSGDVWIMESGTENWEKITGNSQIVFPGDKIKTGENAQNVSFTYSRDNSYLAIKSGAIVTIFEEQLCIQRGDVYVNVTKKGDKFLVVTPTAVTGPRGTEFSVNVNSAGKTNVHLYEGAIELRNSNEISYLVPGEEASINSEDTEITTQEFNIQDHKQQNWNQLNRKSNNQQLSNFSNPFKNVSGGGKIVGGR